eukprot:RCo012828
MRCELPMVSPDDDLSAEDESLATENVVLQMDDLTKSRSVGFSGAASSSSSPPPATTSAQEGSAPEASLCSPVASEGSVSATQEPRLFSYYCVVELELREKDLAPNMIYSYPVTPSQLKELYPNICRFCFADLPEPFLNNMRFVFTLTNSEGRRLHGVCQRSLRRSAAGADVREPLTLQCRCILSASTSFNLLHGVLESIQKEGEEALKALYHSGLPVGSPASAGSPTSSLSALTRAEFPHEHANLLPLFACFGVEGVLLLLSCVLEERRVVVLAPTVDVSSDCVHAMAALIYPFQWHQVFVPVLPSGMEEMLYAPMPYLIGVVPASPAAAQSLLKTLCGSELVVVADCAAGKITTPHPHSPLPFHDSLHESLTAALQGHRQGSPVGSPVGGATFNRVVLRCLLQYFAGLLGRVPAFVHPNPEDAEPMLFLTAFLRAVPTSAELAPFFHALQETQMFRQLLDLTGESGVFSKPCFRAMVAQMYPSLRLPCSPSESPLAPPSPPDDALQAALLGNPVVVRLRRPSAEPQTGTVRFVGPTRFAPGVWVGIELDRAEMGRHAGSRDGVEYFECHAKRGLFVHPGLVLALEPSCFAELEQQRAVRATTPARTSPPRVSMDGRLTP